MRQRDVLRHGVVMALLFEKGDPLAIEALDSIRDSHSTFPPRLYELWLDSFVQAIREHDPYFDDDDDPKGNTHWDGFGKEALDLFDRSICCNVDVIGGVFHQKVTHPSPCKIGDNLK